MRVLEGLANWRMNRIFTCICKPYLCGCMSALLECLSEIAHAADLILSIYSGTDRAVTKEKRMQGLIEPDRDDKGGLKVGSDSVVGRIRDTK